MLAVVTIKTNLDIAKIALGDFSNRALIVFFALVNDCRTIAPTIHVLNRAFAISANEVIYLLFANTTDVPACMRIGSIAFWASP